LTSKQADISLSPLKITFIYLVVAGLWIAFTDQLLESLGTDAHALSILQTYKGMLYVLLTSLGLYYLIKQHEKQIETKELKLENMLADLRSEKELKDVLFERIPVLITIYDPELNSFEVNEEFRKVIGWSNKEIEEQDIDLLKECYPDIQEREEIVEFMNTPGIGWKEFTITTKSGKEIPTSWTNVKLTDDTSVGIGIDMTEIKASQAKIRESRELLKKIFESLKSSLIIVDPHNRIIVDCNPATKEIFGYTEEELVGNSTRILHVDDESYQEFDKMGAKSLEENGVFQTEYQMQKKDGTIFHSDHTVTLVYDEEGEIDKVMSVVRDITDQKEYEQKLKQRHERLLRSQRIGNVGDWEFNPTTEDLFWSSMMFEIYERNPELGSPSF
jgi:PAS domain S-box-containing protein